MKVRCPKCGEDHVYWSRSRNRGLPLLISLFVTIGRCHDCGHAARYRGILLLGPELRMLPDDWPDSETGTVSPLPDEETLGGEHLQSPATQSLTTVPLDPETSRAADEGSYLRQVSQPALIPAVWEDRPTVLSERRLTVGTSPVGSPRETTGLCSAATVDSVAPMAGAVAEESSLPSSRRRSSAFYTLVVVTLFAFAGIAGLAWYNASPPSSDAVLAPFPLLKQAATDTESHSASPPDEPPSAAVKPAVQPATAEIDCEQAAPAPDILQTKDVRAGLQLPAENRPVQNREPGGFRIWRDAAKTREVAARLLRVEGHSAVLLREDGREVTVPWQLLSAEDQDFVKAFSAGGSSDGTIP